MKTFHFKSLLWAGLFTATATAVALSACGGDSKSSSKGSNFESAYSLYSGLAASVNNTKHLAFVADAKLTGNGTLNGTTREGELASGNASVVLNRATPGAYQAAVAINRLSVINDIADEIEEEIEGEGGANTGSSSNSGNLEIPGADNIHPQFYLDGGKIYVTDGAAETPDTSQFAAPAKLDEVIAGLKFMPTPAKSDVESANISSDGLTITLKLSPNVLKNYFNQIRDYATGNTTAMDVLTELKVDPNELFDKFDELNLNIAWQPTDIKVTLNTNGSLKEVVYGFAVKVTYEGETVDLALTSTFTDISLTPTSIVLPEGYENFTEKATGSLLK